MENKNPYRWFVFTICTVSLALTWGPSYSIGVLYKDWIRYFNSPASFTSLAGALATAVSGGGGPIFGFLVDKLGIRKCAVLSGIISAVGMATSSFAESVGILCITFGMFFGFGIGLHCFTSAAMINDYFVHDRMLAEGMVGGGLCVGIFVFSYLLQALSNLYTWKGAMLITGAICLHISLLSMFFIPSSLSLTHPLNLWKIKYDVKRRGKGKLETSTATHMTDLPKEIIAAEGKNANDPTDENLSGKEGFFRRSYLLFHNPVFLIHLTSDFLSWLALFIPYVHLVERARQERMDENTASWLSSTFGLGGIIGRPLTGYICHRFHFHPLWSYCAVQMICGMSTFLSSFWSDVYGLFTFAAIFGFMSIGNGLIKASVAYLLEPRCFVDAYSWMLLFEGIGVALGPVLAGVIYDSLQSYNWSFRFAGFILIISAATCFLIPVVDNPHRRRHQVVDNDKKFYI